MVKGKKYLFSLLPLLLVTVYSCGQHTAITASPDMAITVEKQACEYGKLNGSKLIIRVKEGSIERASKVNNYGFTEISGLNDEVKLKIVEKLLQYKEDTFGVCLPVRNYGYEGYENTCKEKPASKRFNIQVDALYSINRLCFPQASSFYYCFPVIFDTQTGKEVNDEYMAIKAYFEIYEKWFDDVKKSGTIGKDFPFNTGRYYWLGGRKSEVNSD